MSDNRAWVVGLGTLIFLVVLAGFALYIISPLIGFGSRRIFLSIMLIAVALVTFFGFLWHGLEGDQTLDEGNLRTAIAVSMVTVYLVLVGIVVFWRVNGEQDPLPKITETMLASFTALIAIVVPFYFGSSAYVQVRKQELSNRPSAQGDRAE